MSCYSLEKTQIKKATNSFVKRWGHPQSTKVEPKMRGGLWHQMNIKCCGRVSRRDWGKPAWCWSWAPESCPKDNFWVCHNPTTVYRPSLLLLLLLLLQLLLLFFLLGSLNMQGSYLTTVFQTDLLTVTYTLSRGCKIREKLGGRKKESCLQPDLCKFNCGNRISFCVNPYYAFVQEAVPFGSKLEEGSLGGGVFSSVSFLGILCIL